jgi:hypothetical protein
VLQRRRREGRDPAKRSRPGVPDAAPVERHVTSRIDGASEAAVVPRAGKKLRRDVEQAVVLVRPLRIDDQLLERWRDKSPRQSERRPQGAGSSASRPRSGSFFERRRALRRRSAVSGGLRSRRCCRIPKCRASIASAAVSNRRRGRSTTARRAAQPPWASPDQGHSPHGMALRIDAAGRRAVPGRFKGGMKQRHELRANEPVHDVALLGKDRGPQPHRDRRVTGQ